MTSGATMEGRDGKILKNKKKKRERDYFVSLLWVANDLCD
jgi:hypothetical protein